MAIGTVLKGQAAVVTGGNSGIGAATALAIGAAGADVAINYIANDEEAARIVERIRESGSRALAIKGDISKEEDVRELFSAACRAFGTIDILVSNAGIQRDASITAMTFAQWQAVLDVNLNGAFFSAREAAREFRRRGVVRERSRAAGKIIFISSVHEVIPWSGHANYAASKGGVMLLMKSLAQELAPERIRVNSIGPGAIKTAINREAWETEEAASRLKGLIPYGRIGEPEDVAAAAVWLASDESDYITGTTLYVDGGMLLYPGFRTGG